MQSARLTVNTVLTALIAAAAVFLGTWVLADRLERSAFYRQSQIFGSIASQDQLDIMPILTDPEKRGVMTRFIGALTAAYINFEMIPYSEGPTFAAVFQSLTPEIHVERFEYKRRDLTIRGWADSPEAYDAFAFSLSQSGHFASVTGHKYLAVDDTIRYEIWCQAQYNTPPMLL